MGEGALSLFPFHLSPFPPETPDTQATFPPGGLFEYVFAGYVPLVSHNPYAIIVNSVANYRLRISHLWENVIFAIPS